MIRTRKPKSKRKKLVEKLDGVFSLWIRKRDKKCLTILENGKVCGKTENLQNGHYFTRTAYSTRWDEENCFAQCSGCNMIHEANAEPMRRGMVARIGEARLKEVERRYVRPRKFTDRDLEELIKHYETK